MIFIDELSSFLDSAFNVSVTENTALALDVTLWYDLAALTHRRQRTILRELLRKRIFGG